MKILKILALSALAITANAQSYRITVTGGDMLEGEKIYLADMSDMSYCDSATVTNGTFGFESNTEEQKMLMISHKPSRLNVALIADKGAEINVDLTQGAVTDNGGLNDKKSAFELSVMKAGEAINAKGYQMQAEGKSNEEISAALESDVNAIYELYRKAIEENKENMFGAYILSIAAPALYTNVAELDPVIAEVKYASGIKNIKAFRDMLVQGEATSTGKMFTDFGGFTVDGKPSRLSDYVGKGKFVLVDFWASWCGPCRGEIPNLIELQTKFGGEKFTVLGVNVWDEEESFKEALEAEGLTYPQIYVPVDNDENATELYNIQGIPLIMLFGPDGTIIKRGLRGQEMKNFVAEQLK